VPQVTPSNSREWELELALPLGWITQRAFRVGDATAQVEASREQARAERRDVLLELRILFWSLAHDRARVEALETMRSQTAELARLVTRRVEKGEARPSEASRAEIELEKVEIELEAGRSLLNARQREARLWIKGSESHEIEVEANLAEISPVFDLDSVLSVARSRHPAILAARARVRGSASALSLEKFARIPEVEVRGYASGDTERRMRGVGIAFELPVWNWNAGRITQARAQLDAGRHQLEWRTRETETAVVQAHGASVAAKQTALRYRDRILPRSESAATIMEKAYRLGEASLLEVIDSRRVLVETRLQYLAALLQAHIDDSQLDALTGREDTR
jgi:cobalt-zinc-cadmium efflux system outer membrane protein